MRFLAAVIIALATASAAQSEPAVTAESVLSANHTAVGAMPAAGAAELRYENTASGMTGTLVVRYDLATGAYAEAQEAQGIRNSDGFDGATPWQQDISLAYTPQMG